MKKTYHEYKGFKLERIYDSTVFKPFWRIWNANTSFTSDTFKSAKAKIDEITK